MDTVNGCALIRITILIAMEVCGDNLSFTGDDGAKRRCMVVRLEFRQLLDYPEKYNIAQLKVQF